MHLCIDIGNTRAKAALFEHHKLVDFWLIDKNTFTLPLLPWAEIQEVLYSSVAEEINWLLSQLPANVLVKELNSTFRLPFKNQYASPETLGADRKALIAGAYFNYPNKNCLVIDSGTCITFDFLSEDGTYIGGAISPGLEMRLHAMHDYTHRLPDVSPDSRDSPIGDSTFTGLQSGAYYGVLFEIQGHINWYAQQYSDLVVLLTGGNASLFANRLKGSIFVDNYLLLKGLNSLIISHAENPDLPGLF